MKQIVQVGKAEDDAILQAENCLVGAEAFCLMADNHKGYGMPVGGVAVYKDKICPAGVGFDIACGNKAVMLDIKYEQIRDRLNEIALDIWNKISFGVGRKNNERVEHEIFNLPSWDRGFLAGNNELKEKAQAQLGTVGSGNHYVDVFRDENDNIWIGVHFGSRGLGHTIASHFMKVAGDNPNIMDETPHTLNIGTQEASEYLDAMELAGRYAYAGRDWVCQKVAEILGGNIVEEVHNHHNFAWKEEHSGQEYYVIRKGATPAFPDQKGFIGGSMGENAVIVKGVESEKSKSLFYSTVHGAGRVMSRKKAKELIDMQQVRERIRNTGIVLLGAGADESPEAYKRLPEVLNEHRGTIDIIYNLEPIIVCMAGENDFDPYKD